MSRPILPDLLSGSGLIKKCNKPENFNSMSHLAIFNEQCCYLLLSVDGADLVKSLDAGGQTAVDAEDLKSSSWGENREHNENHISFLSAELNLHEQLMKVCAQNGHNNVMYVPTLTQWNST